MELEHKLRLKIDNGTGLAGLAIIAFAVVALVLGLAALSAWLGNETGGPEVSLDVRSRHRLDQAQQRGIERSPGGALDSRQGLAGPRAHGQ